MFADWIGGGSALLDCSIVILGRVKFCAVSIMFCVFQGHVTPLYIHVILVHSPPVSHTAKKAQAQQNPGTPVGNHRSAQRWDENRVAFIRP